MSNEEKEKKIREQLKAQDVFELKSVHNVNHKPHPFTIGPKHITGDSMYLGKDIMREKGCAHPGCDVSYDNHTSDCIAFLVEIRHSTQEEKSDALKAAFVEGCEEHVDGFAFVESEFSEV